MTSLTAFAEANINGWSILAINEAADSVAKALNSERDALSFEENVFINLVCESEIGESVDEHGNDFNVTVYSDRRCLALVEPINCDWTVILRSIDFLYEEDVAWVGEMAKRLSKDFMTRAITCCGEGECDLYVFDCGKIVKQCLGCNVSEASTIIESLTVSIPACFLAGDPPKVWSSHAVRSHIRRVSLLTVSVTAPKIPAQRRAKLPADRMIASQCLEIVKLNQFVPFQVRSENNSFEATVKKIVFDPLRIDEVNQLFKASGFIFDDEFMKVIAVNVDDSILLWYGFTMVYHLQKGEEKATRALNDILGLTYPFKIKNKKADIDRLLTQLRELNSGESRRS